MDLSRSEMLTRLARLKIARERDDDAAECRLSRCPKCGGVNRTNYTVCAKCVKAAKTEDRAFESSLLGGSREA